MQFQEVIRTNLYKNKYPYKIHFHLNVRWDGQREFWNNKEDKAFMDDIRENLNFRSAGKFSIQGAVVYLESLDDTYWLRVWGDEKIMKIEKALVS